MKRIFSLLIAAMLLLLSGTAPKVTARAASDRFAVVPDGDVWFYAGETESSRVFLLPKTYYVKVLSEGETYSRVEYLVDESPYRKLTGYCKTADVVPVDYVPVRPYLKKQITLSYSLPSGSEGGLGGSFSSVDKTFVYYGQRYEGAKLYYYVLSGETFDYIPAESELAFELNTDYQEYLEAQNAVSTGGIASPTEDGGMNAAVIVVVCVACAAAVAVAVLVVRGKKPPADDQTED